MAFYSLDRINKIGAQYNFLLGPRSCGKTYAVLKQAIEHFFATGEPFVYVRRYKEAIMPSKISDLLKPHYPLIEELSGGEYNFVKLWQGRFWLEYIDENGTKIKKNPQPLGYTAALSVQDNSKGQDVGFVKYIIFDEVIARDGYLKDEFAIFTNLISTYVRQRTGTIIYMLSNPISKFCLYFDEMGIDFNEAEPGNLYVIKYDEEGHMKTAFDYIAPNDLGNGSSSVAKEYFAFGNNQKVKSITSGEWEWLIYPHLPSAVYNLSEKKKELYICFTGKVFCCDFMKYEGVYYLFYRPAKEVPKNSYYLTLDRPLDKYAIVATERNHPFFVLMNELFIKGKVYYSTNQVGDYIDGFRAAARALK